MAVEKKTTPFIIVLAALILIAGTSNVPADVCGKIAGR